MGRHLNRLYDLRKFDDLYNFVYGSQDLKG